MFESTKIPQSVPTVLTDVQSAATLLKDNISRLFDLLETKQKIAEKMAFEGMNNAIATAVDQACQTIEDKIKSIDFCNLELGDAPMIGSLSPFSFKVDADFDKSSGLLKLPPWKILLDVKDILIDWPLIDLGNWNVFVGVVSCKLEEIAAVKVVIQTVAEFFGILELKVLVKKLDILIERPNLDLDLGEIEKPSISFKPPTRLCTFEDMQEAFNQIKQLVEGIRDAFTTAQQIGDMITDFFADLEQQLNDIIAQWEAMIAKLAAALQSDFFHWEYKAAAEGGITTMVQLLEEESNHPPIWKEHEFSVAFYIIAPEAATSMLKIMGLEPW